MSRTTHNLEDFVDLEVLRQIETNVMSNLGCTVVFERLDGSMITQGKTYRWRPFLCESCQFLARFPDGFVECQHSDAEACQIVAASRTPLMYKCRGGFSNFAVPIKVEEEVIACLFGGQFLVFAPKTKSQKEKFSLFCQKFGVHVKLEPGEIIGEGFFYSGKQLDDQQVHEIAKASGIGGFEISELKHTLRIDFSLQGGRIVSIERFMRNFADLVVIAEVVSNSAQKVFDLKRKGNSMHKPSSLARTPIAPNGLPSRFTLSFKVDIPRGKMTPEMYELKVSEIQVLNSTLSPEARKYFAQVVERVPKRELNPEIRKIILEVLMGKKRKSILKDRW